MAPTSQGTAAAAAGRRPYRKRKPTPIRNVNRYDIICTQATRSVEQHQGNVWYNTIIEEYAPQLGACHSAPEKKQLTKTVIERLRREHRDARFIEPIPTPDNTSTGPTDGQHQPQPQPQLYRRVLPESKVHGKVSHALRARWLKLNENQNNNQQQIQQIQQQQQNDDDLFVSSRAVATTNRGIGNMVAGRIGRGDASALQGQQLDSIPNQFPTRSILPSGTLHNNNNNNNNDSNAVQAAIHPDDNDAEYPDELFERDVVESGMAYCFVQHAVPQDVRRISAITSVRRPASPTQPVALMASVNQERPESPLIRYFANMAILHRINTASSDDRQPPDMPDRTVSNAAVRHQNNQSNISVSNNNRDNNANPQTILSSSTVKKEKSTKKSKRHYYYRRKKLKKQKQRDYIVATPEQRQQIDQEQTIRRNSYNFFRRLAIKTENVQERAILSL